MAAKDVSTMRCTTKTAFGQELAAHFGINFLESFGFVEVPLPSSIGNLLPEHNVVVLRESVPLEPHLLPRDLLSTLSVVELKREYTNEQLQTRCRSPEVKAAIEAMQHEENGPSFERNIKLKNFPTRELGQDKGSWNAALGNRFRFSISQVDKKHHGKRQFLTMFTNHPQLEQELCKLADRKASKNVETPYTVGQFVRSIEYIKAKQLAQRNSQRAVAKLAETLGFEIVTSQDILANPAALHDPKTNAITFEKPSQAVPLGFSMFNHLDGFTYMKNQIRYNAVGIYTDCGSIAATTGNPVFPINPFDGIGWVSSVKAETLKNTAVNTADTLGTTLPCGGLSALNTNRPCDDEDAGYIENCLVNNKLEALHAQSPKLVRTYSTKASVVGALSAALPEGARDIRTMWHAFSVV